VNRTELAEKLIVAEEKERANLLREHSDLTDVELAYILKNICHDVWHNDPAKAKAASESLKILNQLSNDSEINAFFHWSTALVSLSESRLEFAVEGFNETQTAFQLIGKESQAASVQANKVVALAILGRYEEAILHGLEARKILERCGEAAVLINLEYNLGNLYLRRNHFREAEKFYLQAREHAIKISHQSLLARITNSLALLYSSQNKFRQAEQLYREALLNAETTNQAILQADIEANIGELSWLQGKYDNALDYLERARRKFAQLGIAQRSALAELEIADAYLELNLQPEAKTHYEKLIGEFVALGMRAEQARVLAQLGLAQMKLGQLDHAQKSFEEARRLYIAEGNPIGAALTKLSLAQLLYEKGRHDKALELIAEIESVFEQAETWRYLLITRWLRGEIERAFDENEKAERTFTQTLQDAEKRTQPQIAQRCFTSLGLLKASLGQRGEAEHYFNRAIDSIETLRAPLPGEEFRAAFFADKLTPYDEMARLCLDDESFDRTEEALRYIESARSRALSDKLGFGFESRTFDEFESQLFGQIETLREELNWHYSQLNRASENSSANKDEIASLNQAIREREQQTLELMRQLQHRWRRDASSNADTVDLSKLRQYLDQETALIEYASLDGEWLAFVLTNEGLFVARYLGSETETTEQIEQLYFQIGSLRQGTESVRKHLPLLTERIQNYLLNLYSILLEPLEDLIGERRLAIVPNKALHYVPFQALFDGQSFVIEKREVCYAPSAKIFEHSLSLPRRALNKALLLGVADERAPKICDEINALAPLFNDTVSFLDSDATIAKLKEHAPNADLLHLACHGQFRHDNPTFSTLRLGDGWLTVHDAARLKLNCELVTLSACETGVNLVAPGDELIGLARGFFAAGTPALILDLLQKSVTDATSSSKGK
jgi:CHAT domain-containing protein